MNRHTQLPFTLPAGATEVVLVRHGSSAAGDGAPTGAFVDGHSDPPLSDAGLAQAEAVAARLAHEPAAALFVTPLQRTAQTAAPLARLKGVEPRVVAELREIHLGDWEGSFQSRMSRGEPLLQQVLRAQSWDVAPGAEPMEQFAARVADGLRIVADAAGPDATAIAVAHGGVIAEACRQATDSRPLAFVEVQNGSITRLVRGPRGSWTLLTFNDVAHLDASADRRRT